MPLPNPTEITVNGLIYKVRPHIVADINRILAPFSKTAVAEDQDKCQADAKPTVSVQPAGEEVKIPESTEPDRGPDGDAVDNEATDDGGPTVSPDPDGAPQYTTPPGGESG